MEAFETFEHEGVTVSLYYDEHAEDPFETHDQLAELVWTERDRAYKNVGGHVSIDHAHYLDTDDFSSVEHAQRYLTLMRRYLVAVPFRVVDYGSGGVRASLVRDPWTDEDLTRISGFVVVSEANREMTGAPLEGLEENALLDWKEWKAWAEGEVFGYVAALPDADEDEQDSCWGFYGDLEYVRKEAREAAEAIASSHRANEEPPDVAEVLAALA